MLGNRKLVEKYSIQNSHIEDENTLSSDGNTIIYIIKNSEIIGLIGVNDIIRSNAKNVIKKLNNKHIQTIMLTGDNKSTAEKIARELGITKVIANVLPSEKADIIKDLKLSNNKVMMCGDGINDSPALANSDIGVSVQSGTDIAMDSSDVILTKNDLSSILKLITISEKTIKNIKQNLFWAFFYNTIGIPLAAGLLIPVLGWKLNPMFGAAAMSLSSFCVVTNALRLNFKKI